MIAALILDGPEIWKINNNLSFVSKFDSLKELHDRSEKLQNMKSTDKRVE